MVLCYAQLTFYTFVALKLIKSNIDKQTRNLMYWNIYVTYM